MLYHANDAWLLLCGVSTQDVLAAVEAEHSQITELSYRIQGEVQCLQTTGLVCFLPDRRTGVDSFTAAQLDTRQKWGVRSRHGSPPTL